MKVRQGQDKLSSDCNRSREALWAGGPFLVNSGGQGAGSVACIRDVAGASPPSRLRALPQETAGSDCQPPRLLGT